MPRPYYKTYSPKDDNLIGYASNATGATWTLTASTPDDGLAHKVSIKNDSATDHSLKTADIVGTAFGKAVTETLALPAGSATVVSVNYYETVTSVTPSATIGADTMDIGWTDDIIGPVHILDHHQNPYEVAINGNVTIDTGITWGIEYTYDDPFIDSSHQALQWLTHSTLAGETADADGTITSPVRAIRLNISALGSASETIKLTILQATSCG